MAGGSCFEPMKPLAKQAGHDVDPALIEPDVWNRASIASYYKQDYGAMCQVIADSTIS